MSFFWPSSLLRSALLSARSSFNASRSVFNWASSFSDAATLSDAALSSSWTLSRSLSNPVNCFLRLSNLDDKLSTSPLSSSILPSLDFLSLSSFSTCLVTSSKSSTASATCEFVSLNSVSSKILDLVKVFNLSSKSSISSWSLALSSSRSFRCFVKLAIRSFAPPRSSWVSWISWSTSSIWLLRAALSLSTPANSSSNFSTLASNSLITPP